MGAFTNMCASISKDVITQNDYAVNTFIANGYISKGLLKQIKNVCKNVSLSQADACMIATMFGIYDGVDDMSVLNMMVSGFSDVVNNCNRLRGVTQLTQEFMIITALCGFDEAVNANNAMGCGAQLMPHCDVDGQSIQAEFHVQTGLQMILDGRSTRGGTY